MTPAPRLTWGGVVEALSRPGVGLPIAAQVSDPPFMGYDAVAVTLPSITSSLFDWSHDLQRRLKEVDTLVQKDERFFVRGLLILTKSSGDLHPIPSWWSGGNPRLPMARPVAEAIRHTSSLMLKVRSDRSKTLETLLLELRWSEQGICPPKTVNVRSIR